jgi:hypothetical protein
MKKIILTLITISTLLLGGTTSEAQVYSKGDIVVDAFYGGPNLYTTVLKAAYNSSNYINPSYTSIGPFGITGEYLLSSKIGIGLEATYALSTFQGSYDNGLGNYTDKVSVNRLRVLPRVNFHFGSSKKFDPYLTCGIGYYSATAKYTSNDPYSTPASLSSPIPIAYRVGFGVRYFFTEHFGLMAEAGFGGALIRGGVTVKF